MLKAEPSIQYIAGFFDGEGSIGVYPNHQRKSYYLTAVLVQNVNTESRALFEYINSVYGGNLGVKATTHGLKFQLQMGSEKAAAFLKDIAPYILLKKPQLEMALKWFDTRPIPVRNQKGHFVSNVREVDEEVYLLLRILKKLPENVVEDFDRVMAKLDAI